MAYDPNTFSQMLADLGDNGTQIFTYKSADAAATVAAAGYISDGGLKGAKLNDLVIVTDTATPLITSHRVSAVATTGNLGLTLSTGITIGNT